MRETDALWQTRGPTGKEYLGNLGRVLCHPPLIRATAEDGSLVSALLAGSAGVIPYNKGHVLDAKRMCTESDATFDSRHDPGDFRFCETNIQGHENCPDQSACEVDLKITKTVAREDGNAIPRRDAVLPERRRKSARSAQELGISQLDAVRRHGDLIAMECLCPIENVV